ncbi:translocation and assembly module lipoprotein TamL [Mucilaginibacter myungsuensis]|uniref:BamA/TamA family outer membrane protein n=1 Tax=Mucilaginibacter myungsuensis TaxID=649104 RepID=A0A929PX71_9SPHI|nr:BamA/TamA family outer membrane protein [Mucilaginibacter myungsuensis]MBE9662871.1 BamA/TamA family outer membrane protein [Mucilaginibacter myungsuensis]MDN3598291.1 BamA/TamA family outer membrane protein [Mucilaginibacter myungsuensis]
MKAYTDLKHKSFTILTILLVFLIAGCSVTRRLKPNEAIVRKVTINGVDKEFADAVPAYVDKQQQPNNWLNLQLYYTFSKNGKNDVGEPPAILDSSLVEYSRLQIEKFLKNKGYLKAKVTDSISVKNKKAHLTFTATEGPMFRIRKFQDSIVSNNMRNIYRDRRKEFSHIQPGARFDSDSLTYDRDVIYMLMKEHGYYDFYRQYINYNVDTTFSNSVVDIKMIIGAPSNGKHNLYRINNTLITIANSNPRDTIKADTLQVDSQFRFVDHSRKFDPRAVTNYIFQKKGDIYDIKQQSLTTTRLSELNVFRNVPNPVYEKLADSSLRLNTRIDIVPLKKMSDRVEGEFIFAGGKYGYNLGNTFTDRNLFRRAEILQIKFNWSVLFDNGGQGKAILNQDFKIGVNLAIPRLVVPFKIPVLGKYGVPHTIFSTNYSHFYQKDLVTRQSFVNSLSYQFFETSHKVHTVTPINVEFSSGSIDPTAREALLSRNLYSYVYLIGRTIFTTGSQYTYQVNADILNSVGSFHYFRGAVDVGGNSMSLATKVLNTQRDTLGQRKAFGHTFAQYTKAEVDYRLYRNVGGERQFVFRANVGMGVPYGNSDLLIFEKNFYAGGANDIRGWLPRTLGPGNFNRAYYADTNTRARLKYLDQFGEVKFTGNVEYRSKLADNFFGTKLKGALFADFGNVWRLKDQVESPGGTFSFANFFNSTALSAGAGLRFDLTFFVFRLDAAFKVKDPQFSGSEQWVLFRHGNELFRNGDFKKRYQVTNGDSYNFMQLNFGIGLPF